MILKGRTKITSDFSQTDLLDVNNVISLINNAKTIHEKNRWEIAWLTNYSKGEQPILNKEKPIRPEINNKLVINHAQMVTRIINGYFLGTPIQYIQAGKSDKKEDIDRLNMYVQYEDKSSIDKELGEYQSICGTAYRIVYTDGEFGDEVPFENKSLNPETTFVVYSNNVSETPLCGVTFYNVYNPNNSFKGTKYYVYTNDNLFVFMSKQNSPLDADDLVDSAIYNIGGVPIVEYPNNMWRIGDWEMCIGLMDAINSLQSGRLDDIDQVVQSLMVFINADIDADTYDAMRESGVISLVNKTGNQSSVDTISNKLDQTGMGGYSQELEQLLYALLSIPDRNNRAGGGGDTGQAVELRDGWADLEIVARNKELCFKKSEKRTLKLILNILNTKDNTNLTLLDVDIKFSRNKSNNLLVKTQSYSNLIATKTLTPEDCLTIVDLVSDVNEYIARGKTFWGDNFAGNTKQTETLENTNNVEEEQI